MTDVVRNEIIWFTCRSNDWVVSQYSVIYEKIDCDLQEIKYNKCGR